MYSSSDFEKLWFLYKTEGEPKGTSINSFCLSQGVPYRDFNTWCVKPRKKIVPVQIEDAPSSDSLVEASPPLQPVVSLFSSQLRSRCSLVISL